MKRTIVALGVVMTTGGAVAPVAHAIEYRLDAGLAAYRWTEHLSYGTPKEQGPILVFGGYVSGFPSIAAPALTLRGDVQVFLGRVNYDTFAQNLSTSLITPSSTHSDYLGVRYEGDVGRRFDAGRASVEPFLGAAYRWWLRVVESGGGAQGYPEIYNTLYGRVGLRGEYALAGGMALRGAASVDPLLWVQERIDQTDLVLQDSVGTLVSGNRLTVQNGHRAGWTIEAGVRAPTVDVTAYWQATRFGESNRVSCFRGSTPALVCFQPQSEQDVFGVKIGVKF